MNKTIYMTFIKNISDKIKNRWLNLNKDYKIDFSLDRDCIDFLQTHFNVYIANLFIKIEKGMYKADLWRLCKLYINSGIYADIDLIPHIPLSALSEDISFYSCLSSNKKSIFQAFIANFSNPKNPIFLVFLLSFLINKSYSVCNGPTHDMYNCLIYMLDIPYIEPEKKYSINLVKLKINIGDSSENIKKIDLHYFPDDITYYIKLHKNTTDHKFDFDIINNYLIIKRIDKNSGWNYNHFIDICFDHNISFFFFEEIMPISTNFRDRGNEMQNCYIRWNKYKIFDSRDKEYKNITGGR